MNEPRISASVRSQGGAPGFTLVELIIVISIIAFLVALAVPSFVEYTRKARRAEAQQLLMNWANNQEIWRANHTTYADTTDIGVPQHDYFNFDTVGTPNATSYTLRATATGGQCKDRAPQSGAAASSVTCGSDTISIPATMVSCGVMTLNQSGVKSQPGCWGRTSGS